MDQKFCAICGAENGEHFTYCKRCGAFLPVVEKFNEEPPVAEEKYNFGDIAYYEYKQYLGAGAEGILYDFERLDKGQRFVFSLPALFLGLLFGFYGLSAWFFYRNLKKMGLMLLIIGAFFTLANTLVNYQACHSLVTEIFGVLGNSKFSVDLAAQQILNSFYYFSSSFVSVFKPVGFFASFFVSAFCLKFYKKDSAKKIMRVKEMCCMHGAPSQSFIFKKLGGTDAALAFLAFLAYLAFPIICLVVAFI
ncbi:MAG: hypothetical protein IIX54_04150 [Clostridia bacterium]|nr:hypothetical protein [Clostridia bacterium]